jgi:hypothetical protein
MRRRNNLIRSQRGHIQRSDVRKKDDQGTQVNHGEKGHDNVKRQFSDYIYNIASGKLAVELIIIAKHTNLSRKTNSYSYIIGQALLIKFEIEFSYLILNFQEWK